MVEDNTPIALDISKIKKILPHKHPFLLVDRVEKLCEDSIVAVKCVTYDEPFFVGHYEMEPVMPGTLIIESLAQAGAIILLNKDEGTIYPLLVGIEKTRFKGKVSPGDKMQLEVKITNVNGCFGKGVGVAKVDENVIVTTELLFKLQYLDGEV